MPAVKSYLSATFFALGDRNYRRFAIGQAVSASGTWMQKLAQAWLVLVLTDSGLVLGLTVALQQLPTLLFTATAGALADRFDKRRILMVTTVYGAVPAVLLGLLVRFDQVEVWMVMVAAVVQGFADAVDKPARMTLVNDIARPEILTNAVAINNIVQESGKLVGPAIAGILIGVGGISLAFFVNAASYAVVLLALALIRPGAVQRGPRVVKLRGNLSSTLRYVAARPDLSVALGLMTVSGLFAYNLNVLIPLLVRDVLGGDARAAGFAFTTVGLGGVVGGLALAGSLRPTSRRQILMALAFALTLTALAMSPTLPVAYVILFLVGTISVTFRSVSASVLQLGADAEMRGRVVSLYFIALTGTSPIGGPLQGWVAEVFSARAGFVLGAVATMVAAVVGYRYLVSRGLWTSGLGAAQEPVATAATVMEDSRIVLEKP